MHFNLRPTRTANAPKELACVCYLIKQTVCQPPSPFSVNGLP
jgi:hypothetical protein